MSEMQNAIVCRFEPRSPRISAFQIQEWIYENLKLEEADISMIQIDGTRRQVFIKFTNTSRMIEVLSEKNGGIEFKHDIGEISQVMIEIVGMGMRKIRIPNLPPDVQISQIKEGLGKYGEVREISEEKWTRTYRYQVSNGGVAEMNLKQHVPSHMTIEGHRALISYEGQPDTCYGCNNIGHYYHDCPHRRRARFTDRLTQPPTWADIAANTERTANTFATNKNTGFPI
jgi:hypothetical protein